MSQKSINCRLKYTSAKNTESLFTVILICWHFHELIKGIKFKLEHLTPQIIEKILKGLGHNLILIKKIEEVS